MRHQPDGVETARPTPLYLPHGDEALWHWILGYLGVRISRERACPDHHSPWEIFKELQLSRPAVALVLGSRGAGKSFLSAINIHLNSLKYPGHGTRVLGGSRAQSLQVYRALRDAVRGGGPLGDRLGRAVRLLNDRATYSNGSEVEILSASPTSVRGPHVPSLLLDEVDEIETDLREAAMGMCMARRGVEASVLLTSTWHRVGGPMSQLIEQASDGQFPLYTICCFDVLERCPDERSGPNLEHCPECCLVKYCHDVGDGGPPRAKRSDGHYTIDSLIQKVLTTSARTFESDYLCRGPRADGLWFPAFDPRVHVSTRAEYDPALNVHLALDSGVFTGAVFFQVTRSLQRTGPVEEVHVFCDYLSESLTAEGNARAILELARTHCNGRIDVASTDPAGGARNPIGPTVIAEYERAGLRPLRRWPSGSIADGLALIESFLHPADGRSRLFIHPRCQATIRAFMGYRRAKRAGQWQDYPEDPQHPHEELIDSLRGGLRVCFPEGRSIQSSLTRVPARRVF